MVHQPSSLEWLSCRPPLAPLCRTETAEVSALDTLRSSRIREDQREFYQLRPIFSRINVSSRATGSCYLSQGQTKLLCTILGPKPSTRVNTRRLGNTAESGCLDFEVTFTPFSRVGRGRITKAGGGIGQSLRHPNDLCGSTEEERLANRLVETFQSVVLLDRFPNTTIEIYLTVLENEGGLTAAAINCVSMALADAGIPSQDLCVAVTVGMITGLHHDATSLEPDSPQPSTSHMGKKEADRRQKPNAIAFEDPNCLILADPTDRELDAYDQLSHTDTTNPLRINCLHLGLCTSDTTVALLDAEGAFSSEETAAALRLAEAACIQIAGELREQLRRQLAHRRHKEHIEAVLTQKLLESIKPQAETVCSSSS